MGEIDFEELDRAVNSLMNQSGPQDKPKDASVATPSAAAESPAPQSPSPATPSEPAVSTTPPVTAQSPIVGRRSGGRFMDVIPSSSARNVAPRPAPSAAPSREAASLQPASEDAPVSISPEDFTNHSKPGASLDKPDSSSEASYAEVPSGDAEGSDISSLEAMSSPFLEGVEVDKRPLGEPADSSSDLESADVSPSAMTMPDPIDFANKSAALEEAQAESGPDAIATNPVEELALQPEFNPEVLAAEAMTVETTAPAPADTSELASETDLQTEVAAETAKGANEKSAAEASSAMAAGDIRPQYTAEPNDAPEPSAVFDAASETPQALAHPPKKKSGWSIIIWILLMIIIGVAGGVAVWYFLIK